MLAPDGEPLAGICVVAYGKPGARLGVTSAAGRYFIPDLQLGRSYQLHYQSCQHASRYLPQWYGGAAQRANSAPVQITQTRLQPLRAVTLRTPAEAAPTRDVINTTSPAAAAGSLATALGLPSAGTPVETVNQTATVQAKDGRIAGVVTATNHKALRGICVEAVRTTGNLIFTMATTSKTGHYRTGRIPAGRYAVGFFPGCGNNGNWLGQVYKNNKLATVRVRAGKTTTGINAVLRLGGEISGTVTNTSGKKLSNICVGPVSHRGGGLWQLLHPAAGDRLIGRLPRAQRARRRLQGPLPALRLHLALHERVVAQRGDVLGLARYSG